MKTEGTACSAADCCVHAYCWFIKLSSKTPSFPSKHLANSKGKKKTLHLAGSLDLCLRTDFFSRIKTFAKNRLHEGGDALTAQLLGRGQTAGLQDELALQLSGQLLHEEGLLEAARRAAVLRSLRQEHSVPKMAHFNSVGIFMAYTEENLNVDFRLMGTVDMCATCLNALQFAPGTSGIKNPFVDRMITMHALTLGNHYMMQVALSKYF